MALRTWSPERDTLLLVGLTDAVVAVTVHPLTRVPVVQVHVAWAVGAGTRAELWEVTGVAGVPARRPCWFQLEGENKGDGISATLLGCDGADHPHEASHKKAKTSKQVPVQQRRH